MPAGRPESWTTPRWPENLARRAHPTQSRRHALAERLARRKGRGLTRIFSEAAERERVERVARLVRDFGPQTGAPLRVLDLGAADGPFSIRLAEDGADVVAVEGRAAHVARMRARAEERGVSITAIHGDVRTLPPEEDGYDVVLCLGLLYHLEAPDVFRMVEYVHAATRHLALVETQVGLSSRHTVEHRGRTYAGQLYPEDVSEPWASLDNPTSFWPTKPSLLNLLADTGFTSVVEALNPAVPDVAEFHDHVLLVARAR